MTARSTTRTASRGGGADEAPAGSRTGQRLSSLAVALGLVLFLGGFAWGALVYLPYAVPTPSMEPTIGAGDRVLAQRVDGGDVRRGDVVVFEDGAWADVPVVKRVVAVGGDTVSTGQDGTLKVNGTEIDEPYLSEDEASGLDAFPEVTVPKGRLFLLGDERSGSLDSSSHLTDPANGTVSREAVRARVDAVVWPVNGMLEPPTGFEELGALSTPGPLPTVVATTLGGAVLILGGAAYGPLARLAGASRTRRADAGADDAR
ncbi:signal peptidase I [Streptomyces prasinopilosus]|uniref:Signal peptidase I n=1 Tax=Streptomyces prasinopilosus TaxID=67344 RepID=A0A1G7B4D2_9ACTN|nr:signal peptidase I [Streptomyces prasinopilosus]SDE21707.1 signal peptidase I [Streptomyces prasinopilosus]